VLAALALVVQPKLCRSEGPHSDLPPTSINHDHTASTFITCFVAEA
jgi:hypothetical protein